MNETIGMAAARTKKEQYEEELKECEDTAKALKDWRAQTCVSTLTSLGATLATSAVLNAVIPSTNHMVLRVIRAMGINLVLSGVYVTVDTEMMKFFKEIARKNDITIEGYKHKIEKAIEAYEEACLDAKKNNAMFRC